MLTKNQAIAHLKGVITMANSDNFYLSCIRTYLRDVNVTVHENVRADTIGGHTDLLEIIDLELKARIQVDNFMRGEL